MRHEFFNMMRRRMAQGWKAAALAALLVMTAANARADMTLTYSAIHDITGTMQDAFRDAEGNKVSPLSNTYDSKTSTGEVTLPDNATSIGGLAFYSCYSLISITIPEGVRSIEGSAFCDCASLSGITLPSTISSVEVSAFDGTAIVNNAPNDMVYLDLKGGAYVAIRYKGNATDLEIKKGTKILAGRVFSDNKTLQTVTIPKSVTYIGDYIFFGCERLTTVRYLGKKEPQHDAYAFGGCAVQKVDVGWNYEYETFCGIPVSKSQPIVLSTFYSTTSDSKPIADNKWEELGTLISNTWDEASKRFVVKYSDKVTSIGEKTFESCSALTSITIPDDVTSIGNYAFFNCENLITVQYLGNGYDCLQGDDVFVFCPLLNRIVVTKDFEGDTFCGFPVSKSQPLTVSNGDAASLQDTAVKGNSKEKVIRDGTLIVK